MLDLWTNMKVVELLVAERNDNGEVKVETSWLVTRHLERKTNPNDCRAMLYRLCRALR